MSASMLEILRQWEDFIFNREKEFLNNFGAGDFDHSLGLIGIWFSSESCKFVWIENSGQHVSDSCSMDELFDWMAKTIAEEQE